MTKLNETHITIDTSTPTLQIGEIQLSADRRTVKGQPELKDHERIRRVVLPANHWEGLTSEYKNETIQSLTDAIQQALKKLASDKLRDYLDEQPLARTVPLAAFTIPAILAWSAETAAGRGALTVTAEEIDSWYATSALRTLMLTKSADHVKLLQSRCTALAANNHGLKTVAEVTKMIALLADDAKHPTVIEMIGRLANIERTMTAKVTKAISLDDI